jgi:hypothetical protein
MCPYRAFNVVFRERLLPFWTFQRDMGVLVALWILDTRTDWSNHSTLFLIYTVFESSLMHCLNILSAHCAVSFVF